MAALCRFSAGVLGEATGVSGTAGCASAAPVKAARNVKLDRMRVRMARPQKSAGNLPNPR